LTGLITDGKILIRKVKINLKMKGDSTMQKFGIKLKEGLLVAVYPFYRDHHNTFIEAENITEAIRKAQEKYGEWYYRKYPERSKLRKKPKFTEEINARYSPQQVYGTKGLL
jgi:hypothetical protein